MASYSIVDVTSSSVTVEIVPDSTYQYYRIFVRLADDASDETFDEIYSFTSTDTVSVSGLNPETDYVVNIGYNNTGVEHVEGWLGANSFTTKSEAEEPSVGDGVVCIYIDGEWVNAVPYIYSNGWQKATPYIYTDTWTATIGL